jgi:hypothetical protein
MFIKEFTKMESGRKQRFIRTPLKGEEWQPVDAAKEHSLWRQG